MCARDEVIVAAEGTTELVLHRGMCFGMCPVYELRFGADGIAVFEGHSYVDMPGRHETALPLEWLLDLAAAAAYLHRMLPARPELDWMGATCLPSNTVRIIVGGQPIQALDAGVVSVLGSLMDQAASELDWGMGDRRPAESEVPREEEPRQRHWAQRLGTY